jgi:lysozyme
MIRVVDVFEGNGAVDWARVKAAGYAGAIHKATQYRVDRFFADHHASIPVAGLHHGCYHFMTPDTAPALQANLYLNTLGWRPGEFGWVIDYERTNGVLPGVAWLSTLLNALPPGPVLLYGNKWDLATLGPTFNGRVKVWVADYGVNDGTPHGDPAAMRAATQFPVADVVLWQFTSRGRVDGISGDVDVSMWLGTDAEWAAYMGESQPVVQGQEEEDELTFTDSTGHYRCDPDGAVYAFNLDGSPGGRYLGGLNNHPDWHAGGGQANGPPFIFGPTAAGGYVITTRDAGGSFHPYVFPPDGSLAK